MDDNIVFLIVTGSWLLGSFFLALLFVLSLSKDAWEAFKTEWKGR